MDSLAKMMNDCIKKNINWRDDLSTKQFVFDSINTAFVLIAIANNISCKRNHTKKDYYWSGNADQSYNDVKSILSVRTSNSKEVHNYHIV